MNFDHVPSQQYHLMNSRQKIVLKPVVIWLQMLIKPPMNMYRVVLTTSTKWQSHLLELHPRLDSGEHQLLI